jgi:endoglucanase
MARLSFLSIFLFSLFSCGGSGSEKDATDDTGSCVPNEDSGENTDACEINFPDLKEPEDTDTGTEETDLPELSTDDLIAHWPLDGNWKDTWGGYDLEPLRQGGFDGADYARGGSNQSYGPTGEAQDNGAFASDFTEMDIRNGVTMEGWYYKAGNNATAVLFGFGDHNWGAPTFAVLDQWGEIFVGTGEKEDRTGVRFARPSSGCWHHLAVIMPPGFENGEPISVFLDGEELASTDGSYSLGSTGLMGSSFRIGTFGLSDGGQMRMDEVRLWARALSDEEVAIAATPSGDGVACPGNYMDWEPGPRCEWEKGEAAPVIKMMGEVRVLTNDTIVVVRDPSNWLFDQIDERCGEYLTAMEEHSDELSSWWTGFQYSFAWLEAVERYWPQLIGALWNPDHFLVAGCEEEAVEPATATHWPQAVREISVPRPGTDGESQKLNRAQVVWNSYLKLPFTLEPGEDYAVRDEWGNRLEFSYDEDKTVSWAIKVNQVGYLADAPSKYAYLGAWESHAGALDLSRFEGAPFALVDAETGEAVLEGTIEYRMDDTALSGEIVYQMDFSSVTTPGEYYVRVPGAGRSWGFVIGQDAMGEAFYTHARGLYHNRCGIDLEEPYTAWTRGDIHQTFRGGFPPDESDYKDHSGEGWGFLDSEGKYVSYSSFAAVAATATDELLEGVDGGWHDAADYDRRSYHFRAVQDLLVSYFMFPANFTDGQLNLPESGNGLPDILDEARWGIDVWMAAQEDSGGVGTWIEATSHPQEWDPGADTQPYYLSLATRNSSLEYARYAAMLARALTQAGQPDKAKPYLESAVAAYHFGTDPTVRVSNSWDAGGETHTWIEAPTPDGERRVWALIELWLASGDSSYQAELETPVMGETFLHAVDQLWWQNLIYMAVNVGLESESFPDGWGDAAKAAVVWRADAWVSAYETHAYRRVWYAADHGYFSLMGWGNAVFMPLRSLVAAWRFTGDETYRDAALTGLDYLHGANGQGRVNTTGLGDHDAAVALHLPSWADEHDELSPGITLYGDIGGIPWVARTHVYGLQEGERTNPNYVGVEKAMMPPPWDNDSLSLEAVGEVLYAVLPGWRRLLPLEALVVPSMEFTMWETISPAASVTGCLLGEGWEPSPELLERKPRTEEELRSSIWMMP